MKSKNCQVCDQSFTPKGSRSRWCSVACNFWSKVERRHAGECWLWIAAITPTTGYGNFFLGTVGGRKKWQAAHRVAYELTNGPVEAGHFVCHRCDNRACCNPGHLFPGTPKENTADMWEKGRQHSYTSMQSGAERHNAKLSDDIVLSIRAAAPFRHLVDIASEIGVSVSTVFNVVNGRTWRHVKGMELVRLPHKGTVA